MIHPTAIIHPKAKVDPTVTVGPYAVIDGDVTVGPHCVVGTHAYLTGVTEIGSHNQFFASCVIGEAPQDLKYKGAPTGLRIGTHNVFREHVTIHRSNTPAEDTEIGSHNFLMATCHVGHNSRVGNHIIMANGSMLGGHVEVGDRAIISGNSAVHQFVRIGTLSMLQGGSGVSADLPPYTVVQHINELTGLNIVGLRRAGFSPADRLELKQLYHFLFRGGRNMGLAMAEARERFRSPGAKTMMDFIASAKRPVCAEPVRSNSQPSEEDSDNEE